MKKTDIVKALHEKSGNMKLEEAADLIETVLFVMKQALATGQDVKLPEFGTFEVKHKKERKGWNPKKGEPMMIASRHVVKFKPSKMLVAAVNNRDGSKADLQT